MGAGFIDGETEEGTGGEADVGFGGVESPIFPFS
jgi:hypothetical protein